MEGNKPSFNSNTNSNYFIIMNKKFKCQIIFTGQNAQSVIVEAVNPPQAKQFAEARYPGGRCVSANQI